MKSDAIAEVAEQIVGVIASASNGASIVEASAFSIITIDANGLYNGEVGFRTRAVELDEDGVGNVNLTVTRTGKAVDDITVG